MKIALISTPFFGVFPPSYGGLEVVVGNLARALVDRGHRVVLIAPDESQDFDGGFVFRTGPAHTTVGVNWMQAEQNMWNKYDRILDDFDVVNGHNWFGYEYRSKTRNQDINACHTHHGHIDPNWWCRTQPPFKLNLIGISRFMAEQYSTGYGDRIKCRIPAEHAYNGIDLSAYPYQKEKSDRLMFLGRIDPIKAPHFAIDVAEKTNMNIDIIGGTSFVANKEYVDQTKTKCSQSTYANFVGEVDHQTKLTYLQNAKALLIPSQFGEPFGLIAVEAMSCGTVPIALRDGALGEIIEHGKSGFLCNSIDEMIDAVNKVDTIDPRNCRAKAEQFSKAKMAERYEELYERILSGDSW